MAESATERDFDEFVRLHSVSLLRSARLLTGDLHSAEDLLQLTFSDLYRKWSKVTDADVPLAYVTRSMINRSHSLRRRKSSSELSMWDVPAPPPVADLSDQVAARRDLVALLAGLPARQRSAIVLRYFHDMDDVEIAGFLGCRPATVRSLLSRALKALGSSTDIGNSQTRGAGR